MRVVLADPEEGMEGRGARGARGGSIRLEAPTTNWSQVMC